MRWLLILFLLMAGGARADDLQPVGGSLKAPALWQAYKAAFVSPGGRVIDNANNGISHSEGQGYGMLLAVAAGDRESFDLIWTWTRGQLLLRNDGLAAWKWDPAATPHVGDRNNAFDGDLLIAWALAEAGAYWRDPAYRTAALQLANAIGDNGLARVRQGVVVKPGMAGFSAVDRPDGPIVNLSYWVFPALARLGALAPDKPFPQAIKTGLALLASARFGPAGLPADWISLKADPPRPAQGMPPTFGYDAIRIPLYLMWGGVGGKAGLAPFAAAWSDASIAPQRLDVAAGKSLGAFDDSGYRAVAALVRCAGGNGKLGADIAAPEVDRYYPTTLRLLVLIAARQRMPQCL